MLCGGRQAWPRWKTVHASAEMGSHVVPSTTRSGIANRRYVDRTDHNLFSFAGVRLAHDATVVIHNH